MAETLITGGIRIEQLRKRNFVHPHITRVRGSWAEVMHFADGNSPALIDATNTIIACSYKAPADGNLEAVMFGVGNVLTSGSPSLTLKVEATDGITSYPNNVANGGLSAAITPVVPYNLTNQLATWSGGVGSEYPVLTYGEEFALLFIEGGTGSPSYYLRHAGTLLGGASAASYPYSSYATSARVWGRGTSNTANVPYIYVKVSGVWYNMGFPMPPRISANVSIATTLEYGLAITPVHDAALSGLRIPINMLPTSSAWFFAVYSDDTDADSLESVFVDTDVKASTTTGGTVDVMFPSVVRLLKGNKYFIGWSCPSTGGSFRTMALPDESSNGDVRRAVFGHACYYTTRLYSAGAPYANWASFDAASPIIPILGIANAGNYQ